MCTGCHYYDLVDIIAHSSIICIRRDGCKKHQQSFVGIDEWTYKIIKV